MGIKHDFGPLTFGFDIGIASVGWAVVGDDPIEWGTRAFDAAEDSDGKPHNQARRGARVSRNRYAIRAYRLRALRQLFLKSGLLSQAEIESLFSETRATKARSEQMQLNVWQLRCEGLKRKLAPTEWAAVLYYLVKHRGFKFFRKSELDIAEKKEAASEAEARDSLKQGLSASGALLEKYSATQEKYVHFQTIGEACYRLAQVKPNLDGDYEDTVDTNGRLFGRSDCKNFALPLRNKEKNYRHAFNRDDLQKELEILFAVQRDKENLYAFLPLSEAQTVLSQVQVSSENKPVAANFAAQVLALFELQHPAVYAIQMDALIGECELESEARNGAGKSQRRAAKHTASNERSTWLQTLNNLRINRNGKTDDPLSQAEYEALIDLPYTQSALTFAQARKVLVEKCDFSEDWRDAGFTVLPYRAKLKLNEKLLSIHCADGSKKLITKYRHEDKTTSKKIKERLSDINTTYSDLRTFLELKKGELFEYHDKSTGKKIVIAPMDEGAKIPSIYEDPQTVAEDKKLAELKGWHTLRRALEKTEPDYWGSLQAAFKAPQSVGGKLAAKQIDEIVEVLTRAQTDTEKTLGLGQLKHTRLTPNQVEALQNIHLTQYRNLSLAALEKILPYLALKKSYKDSCISAGYSPIKHERLKYLPPLETCLYERIHHGKKTGHTELRVRDIVNPVVARAFNQARLVLNALIHKYGAPAYINIELARDLAKSKEQQDLIKNRNEENARRRKQIGDWIKDTYPSVKVNKELIDKKIYYEEQGGHCAYSLVELNLSDVMTVDNYAQVDHIWPKSKTFDDNMNNKVLVHTKANQDKSDRIPFDFIREKFGEEHWRKFKGNINQCGGMSGEKKMRLLAEELNADEFMARNLVDTRYVTRLFARVIRERLLFAGEISDQIDDIDSEETGTEKLRKFNITRVRTPQGGITAKLRWEWLGHAKDRSAGDTHHALDACIIASVTPKVINQLNNYYANQEKFPRRFKRLRGDGAKDGDYFDRATGETISKAIAKQRGIFLPSPWTMTRGEFFAQHKTVFVSRVVRNKRNVKLHDANSQAIRKIFVPLTELTREVLKNVSESNTLRPRHAALINAIKTRLEAYEGNAKNAFSNGFTDPQDPLIKHQAVALPLIFLSDDLISSWKSTQKEQNKINAKAALTNEKNGLEAFKNIPTKRFELTALKQAYLTEKNLSPQFYQRNEALIKALIARLDEFSDDASEAFLAPFSHQGNRIRSIQLPISVIGAVKSKQEVMDYVAMKRFDLTAIKKNDLTEEKLGPQFFQRNERLIAALTKQLDQFNDDPKKAFKETFYPFAEGKDRGTPIKSIRLPHSVKPATIIRGGLAQVGDALYTEVFKLNDEYLYRSRYNIAYESIVKPANMPRGAEFQFNLSKNDYVRINHPNFNQCFREIARTIDASENEIVQVEAIFPNGVFEGYWQQYQPSNDRPVVQLHDGSKFFLIEAGKQITEATFSVVAEAVKQRKSEDLIAKKGKVTPKYSLICDHKNETPIGFQLTDEIERKTTGAILIQKLKVGILGEITEVDCDDLA